MKIIAMMLLICLVFFPGCDPGGNHGASIPPIAAATTPAGATIESGMTIDDVHSRIGIPYKDRQYGPEFTDRLWIYYLEGGAGKEDSYFFLVLNIKSPGIVTGIFTARHEPKTQCAVYYEFLNKISDNNKAKWGE